MHGASDPQLVAGAVCIADLLDVSRLLTFSCQHGASEATIAQLFLLRREYSRAYVAWRDQAMSEAGGDRALWGQRIDTARSLACEIRGMGEWVPGRDFAPHGAALH